FHFEPPSPFTSLDYLVGQRHESRRHLDAERLSCSRVDHELEAGWLLDRQIRRPRSLQNLIYEGCCPPICIQQISSVRHQPASLREVAEGVERRESITESNLCKLIPMHDRKGGRRDVDCVTFVFDHSLECRVKISR